MFLSITGVLKYTSAFLSDAFFNEVTEKAYSASQKASHATGLSIPTYGHTESYIYIGNEVKSVPNTASEFETLQFAMESHLNAHRNTQSFGSAFGRFNLEISWIQYKVVQHKTLWNEWSCVTCIEEVDKTSPLSVLIVLTWNAKASAESGFNFAVANFAALKSGFITSEKFEKQIKLLYRLENGVGQLLVRQLMVSQQQKFRMCKWDSNFKRYSCDPWSIIVLATLPVVGGHDLRWVTGNMNVDWNKCVNTAPA